MIEKLMELCGLGEVTGEITAVSGGLMHRMYRVPTESGVYAVKKLNAEIMERPDAVANFERAERLEAVLEKCGVPIVPALAFSGRKMQRLDGLTAEHFYIFRWQEGSITDMKTLTPQQCFLAGELLGKVHSAEIKGAVAEAGEPFRMDIDKFIEKAMEQDSDLAEILKAERAMLERAERKLNEIRSLVPRRVSIINDDMDPKNVMWNGGAPVMIDLECLDTGDPYASCMNLALQWAEKDGDISGERLGAFLAGYSEVCGGLPEGFDRYYFAGYAWLEWLEYNLRRALGGSGDSDVSEGRREALAAIERIRCLEKSEDGVRRMIRETAGRTAPA